MTMTNNESAKYLKALAQRMNSDEAITGGPSSGSHDSVATFAYNEAGELSDLSLVQPLLTLIDREKKVGLKTTLITILGYLLQNTPVPYAYNWIAEQLDTETKVSILDSLLYALSVQQRPIPIKPSLIVRFIDHKEYRLRDRAYEVCDGWHERQIIAALNKRLKITNDPLETPAIQAALSETGDETSFALISSNLKNKSLHIRTSAKVIIEGWEKARPSMN